MSGLVKFAAKIGAVGGTIYYTKSLGVWNDSSDIERVYRNIHSLIAPYIQEIPVEVPELPRITDLTSLAKTYWNSGVLETGRFCLDLPERTSGLAKSGYNMILAQLSAPTEST